jgi:hypothetical protein
MILLSICLRRSWTEIHADLEREDTPRKTGSKLSGMRSHDAALYTRNPLSISEMFTEYRLLPGVGFRRRLRPHEHLVIRVDPKGSLAANSI